MSAQAASNANLTNHKDDLGTTGFVPGVDYTYDGAAKEVDVNDASVFPAGVMLDKIHVRVHDKFGGEVRGTIENPPGSESGASRETTINVSTLDTSKPLDITATVLGNDGKLVADGSAYNIGAAGSLGSWDKQKNA